MAKKQKKNKKVGITKATSEAREVVPEGHAVLLVKPKKAGSGFVGKQSKAKVKAFNEAWSIRKAIESD